MRISITIASNDNAAFQPEPWPQLAACLSEAVNRIESAGGELINGTLRDENGNPCGSFSVSK